MRYASRLVKYDAFITRKILLYTSKFSPYYHFIGDHVLKNVCLIDLQLMLCGMQEIDVDDWQRNTRYKSYTDQSSQVVWFWKVRRRALVSLLFCSRPVVTCLTVVCEILGLNLTEGSCVYFVKAL